MIWLRKGFVSLLSVILLVGLLGFVSSTNFNHNLANPSKLKSWLVSSKFYDHLVPVELAQAQQSSQQNGNDSSIPLSDPAVKQAAEQAFPTSLLESSANAFLDSNYGWLGGKAAAPDFNIDLSDAKQQFGDLVGQAAETHLASLPVCSDAQLAQLTIPIDSLSVTCRPATLSPQAENSRISQAIDSSDDILSDPVITPTSLNQDIQISQASQGQPYYQKLSWAPKLYQTLRKLPLIMAGLALLSALGIVFIAPTRRRGARRIGVILVEAGLVLLIEKLAADELVKKFATMTIHNQTLSQFKQPLNDLLRQAEPQLVKLYLWFGLLFLVAGVATLAVLFKTRHGSTKPKPPIPIAGPPQDSPLEASDIQLAPRHHQPSAGATDLQPTPPRPTPTPSNPQPLGKTPPRPKRPRLIQ
jgi:hypothetical protein